MVLLATAAAVPSLLVARPWSSSTSSLHPYHATLLDQRGGVSAGETTLTYCHNGGTYETLDVYEPAKIPSKQVPVVVYVHGGGWTAGSSSLTQWSFISQVASAIRDKGWVFVSINYRLAPKFPWPAQIEDAKCAIRFIRARASSLHIDSSKIGALGDSAGGQLVSMLGLTGNTKLFDVGQYRNESSAVETVVDLFGPTDLTNSDWRGAYGVNTVARSVFGTLLGPGSSKAAELMAASPVTYVGSHEPPFLIMQGTDDEVVPPGQSTELAYKLAAAGNSVSLVMVHGAQHEFSPEKDQTPSPDQTDLVLAAGAFLVKNLEPAS